MNPPNDAVTRCLNRLISDGGSMDDEVREAFNTLNHVATFMLNVIKERDQLRTDLAAAVAERDRIKGDHDEAAHFARHFIRDDPNITPRGAIIRLGDKCTDLFVRLQQAEARLAAIDAAPVVAWQDVHDPSDLYWRRPDPAQVDTRELIARPAKDSP